jgi:hypothetical protein
VNNEQRFEPRNNNPMRNRNMMNNYDGRYRNSQTERQSYNRFDGSYWRSNNNKNNWKNDEFYQDYDCNNSYNKDINMRLLRLALGFR